MCKTHIMCAKNSENTFKFVMKLFTEDCRLCFSRHGVHVYVYVCVRMLPACTGYLHKQSFIIRSLFDFFLVFYITSVSFLVPLFRVCAFVTFFVKILCYCVMSRRGCVKTSSAS